MSLSAVLSVSQAGCSKLILELAGVPSLLRYPVRVASWVFMIRMNRVSPIAVENRDN
jgi:hypothetical protein